MLRAPAGKTTLMDCLAGRKTTGLITGDVRVAGYPKVQQTFARVMGYVEQVCHFFLSGASLMGHHAADANSAARAGKTQCPYGGSYACMACRLPIPPTPACQQALSSRPKLPNSISCVCFLPAERHPQQQHHGAGELVFSARLRFTSEVKRNIVYAFVQEVCLLLFLAAPSVMHAAECMWQWFRMLRLVSRHLPIAPPLLQCEHACSWRFCWCVAVAECSRVSAGTCQISRESPFNPK